MNDVLAFPIGRDYAWLAQDAVGHVAIFTNGGCGPIPKSVLVDRTLADQAESLIDALPVVGRCQTLACLPSPEVFDAFAARGLFVFDWQDCHRDRDFSSRYELVSRPARPISHSELNGDLAALSEIVRFSSLRFAESRAVDASQNVDCVRP
ncbi:MAG: hypothetical protein U0136_09255 [Bdellovibrionota bacterium]